MTDSHHPSLELSTDSGTITNTNSDPVGTIAKHLYLKDKLATSRQGKILLHINARSLYSSIGEISPIIRHSNAQIIGVSETWLNKNYLNRKAVEIHGYRLFSHPRQRDMRGGGVAAYVQKNINAKVINKSDDTSSIEYLFIECKSATTSTAIGICYNPPPADNLGNLEAVLAELSTNYDEILLMGDFNVDILKSDNEKTTEFMNFWYGLNLTPITFGPTRFGCHGQSSLDLFIVKNPSKVIKKA